MYCANKICPFNLVFVRSTVCSIHTDLYVLQTFTYPQNNVSKKHKEFPRTMLQHIFMPSFTKLKASKTGSIET